MHRRTRHWRIGLTVAVALSLAASTVMGAASLSSIAPGSDEISGWAALQADKSATSPDELWKIYNGGDGPWKTAGVTSAFQRYYKNGTTGHVLTLILHKTGTDWQKTKALYTKKDAEINDQAGYQAVSVKAAGTLATPTQGLVGHMWSKYYYCTVTINGTSAQDVEAAKKFMANVSAEITKNG